MALDSRAGQAEMVSLGSKVLLSPTVKSMNNDISALRGGTSSSMMFYSPQVFCLYNFCAFSNHFSLDLPDTKVSFLLLTLLSLIDRSR